MQSAKTKNLSVKAFAAKVLGKVLH